MGTLRRTCATAPRRGPFPKLLWADLFTERYVFQSAVGATVIMAYDKPTHERRC